MVRPSTSASKVHLPIGSFLTLTRMLHGKLPVCLRDGSYARSRIEPARGLTAEVRCALMPAMSTLKPWAQRLLIGMMVSVMTAGITAFSFIIWDNNRVAVATHTSVVIMKDDFDRFVELRYQSDMDAIDTRFADVTRRIDDLIDGGANR